MTHQCPSCGDALARKDTYRCPACGHDLVGDSPSTGREGR